MLLYEAAQRDARHRQADAIEAVGFGYGGIKTKAGERITNSHITTLRK